MWCPTLRVVTYWGEEKINSSTRLRRCPFMLLMPLTFVGSQEDRCEIRYNMLYGEGEPEFEIVLSTYVYAYPIEATFLLLVHILMLHACMFSIETNVLLLDIGL